MNGSASGGQKTNEPICSFCSKSQAAVKKLIAGPDVFICDECARLAEDSALPQRPRRAESCSFCGMPRADVMTLASGPIAAICGECVELAVAILDEEEAQQKK